MDQQQMIRKCLPEDVPAIEGIIKASWHIGLDCVREKRYGFQIGGIPWQERRWDPTKRSILAHPEDWFVTEMDGRVVGFCSLSSDDSTGIGRVRENGVHPDSRGQGVGSGQLQFVLAELRRRGMKMAEVSTGLNDGHAPARRMYERAGFEPMSDSRIYTLNLSDD